MATVDEYSVKLKGPGGASATIALLGATVVSFIGEDGEERLFKSSKSPLSGPKAIRGGVPIVFPCFGPPPKEPPFDKLVQHGFARTSKWSYEKGDDPAVAVFTLEPNAEIKKVYEPDFKLTYTVKVSAGDVLETIFEVTNPNRASSPLKFQSLFHTYFRLPEGVLPSDVTISDTLTGLSYLDKTQNYRELKQEDKDFTFVNETDRQWFGVPKSYAAKYGQSGQGLKIETENMNDLVTWNPHVEKSATMADMEVEGWKRFVCLEPGHIKDFIELPPGETWRGSQRITALSERLSLPANNAAL